jgi:hypothetical protein
MNSLPYGKCLTGTLSDCSADSSPLIRSRSTRKGAGRVEFRWDGAIIDGDAFGVGDARHIDDAVEIGAVIELLTELAPGLLRPPAHNVGRNT